MVRTSAPNSSAGLFVDENVGGGITGTTVVAADLNNYQEEIANAIEQLGLTLSGADQHQLAQAIVGLSHQVGELVFMETEETPGTYFPAVPRNVDQDITSTVYPLLVTKLRAVKAKVLGVTDHAGATVSGSVITLPATSAAVALIGLLVQDAIVSKWFSTSEAASFDNTPDYSTAATRRCINVAGTDYAITAINATSRQITVSGTPASGSQSVCVYTYRKAGAATTARLHKIAGFVGVAAGDAGGEVVGGFRKMDRAQGHYHRITSGNADQSGGTAGGYRGATATEDTKVTVPVTDTVNGTPRTGKTTDPRTAGQYVYTWAGIKAA